MIRTACQGIVRASGACLLGGGLYGTFLYQTDDGFRRAIQAYQTVIPVALHYRYLEWIDATIGTTQDDWEKLDERYAVPTVSKLGQLQGMYCKYCQTAAGWNNTFGEAWIREFRKLENEVPPRDIKAVYQTVEEETGKPVHETFASFDPIPLGSASIGQVHRATLLDGREVAVKVQYAEAQALFQHDIHTIRSICEKLAPEHIVLLEAIEKQNAAELDYRNEANNLQEIHQNMRQHGFHPREVVAPQALKELSTARMLVMDLLPGPKLVDGMRNYASQWAQDHGTTLHDLEVAARERIETDGIPSKYNGPSAWQISLYRCYLRLKDRALNVVSATYNGTLGWFTHPMSYHNSTLPPNAPRIIDTLMRVHGTQLLVDGVFNADPNGGNFLLMPDGRIALIDYGAVKRFSRNERLTVCLIYAALARRDEARLYDLCKVGGYKSKYGKSRVVYKLFQFGYDSWGKDVTGDKNIQQFIDDLKKDDPWEEVPDNFTMAKLMSIRLRALAMGMNHPVRCSDWWGGIAEEVLRQEGLPYNNWTYDMIVKYKPNMNIQKYKFA
ncbi:ABC1 family-domain containing protein [Nitzschia inconspicua]|uniref:ABC1 family-domain containing protein n=1 Tax=Nitzschia inconspicua TaxID=303405 RepID=A0A9K3PEW2_9STRA|nr:ABC1 family-domain containing protein [Nitzschia inconspicua]